MERRTLWLTAGFAAGLLFVGIPYWSLPYNADYLADPNLRLGLLALALITTLLAGSAVARAKQLFWIMFAVFPLVAMIRVIVDTSKDPTSHNLWPFELVFALILSAIVVGIGLAVGALACRLIARG